MEKKPVVARAIPYDSRVKRTGRGQTEHHPDRVGRLRIWRFRSIWWWSGAWHDDCDLPGPTWRAAGSGMDARLGAQAGRLPDLLHRQVAPWRIGLRAADR